MHVFLLTHEAGAHWKVARPPERTPGDGGKGGCGFEVRAICLRFLLLLNNGALTRCLETTPCHLPVSRVRLLGRAQLGLWLRGPGVCWAVVSWEAQQKGNDSYRPSAVPFGRRTEGVISWLTVALRPGHVWVTASQRTAVIFLQSQRGGVAGRGCSLDA